MKNYIIFVKRFVLLTAFFFVGFAFFANQVQGSFSIEVNVFNSSVTYENNDIEVSFDLSNGRGAQSGMKYGVQLMKDSVVIDEKVYDEVFDLAEDEILPKQVQYKAPSYLQGIYQLRVIVRSYSGSPIAYSLDNEVSLMGIGRYLNIDNSSCYVSIAWEDGKYTIQEGVDVSSEETLVLTCNVSNHFDKKMYFTPVFETHHRSTFGEIVPVAATDRDNKNVLEAGETREISFVISKPVIPQAYDTILSLSDSTTKENISNSIVTHYVVRGGSATVQNIQLDKDTYSKNDVAQVTFSWTPSADYFYGSRADSGTDLEGVVIEGVIEGCSDVFYYTPIKISFDTVTVDVPIINSCQDPKVSLSIKNNDQLLDEALYRVKSSKNDMYLSIILLIVGGLLACGISLFFIFRKKKIIPSRGIKMLFFCLLLTGAVLGGAREVKGEEWAGAIPGSWNGYGAFFTYSLNMTGDPFTLYFQSLTSGECNNASLSLANGYIEVYHDTVFIDKTMYIEEPEGMVSTLYYIFGSHIKQQAVTFPKAATSGNHTVTLKFYAGENELSCSTDEEYGVTSCIPSKEDINYQPIGSKDYTYTVAAAAVNGVCGSSNNGTSPTKPTTGLCSAGTATTVTGTGPWNWNCTGSGGGTTASCSASKTAAVNAPTCDSSTVYWSPASINENGSSTVYWGSSGGATSGTYQCTGAVPMGTSPTSLGTALNSSFPFDFTGKGTGTETCYFTFTNTGGTASCNASLNINEGLSCSFSWSDYNVVVPGSSTATWSSSPLAVSAGYVCTGPLPGAASGLPVSGSATLNFNVGQTGNEVCTVTVADSSGNTATCGSDVKVVVGSVASYSCNPITPPAGKTACVGTGTNLSATTSWTSVTSAATCSANTSTKCQYYTTPTSSYSCNPITPPAGKTACVGTGTNLSATTSWTSVTSAATCSANTSTKCQYYTSASVINGACGNAAKTYADTDTGYSPYVQCNPGTSSNTTFPAAGSSQSWICSGSGGGTNSGTCTASRDACVPGAWTPAVSTVCSTAARFSQTDGCSTQTVSGTKTCPTCTASFNPSSVTVPPDASSTLTWSSTNTDSMKYTCTGPIPGGPTTVVPNGAVNLNFVYGPGGTESCIFTATYTPNGETTTCTTNGGVGTGVVVTPQPPTCSITPSDNLVLSGQSLNLNWISTLSQSGKINTTAVSSLINIPASAFVNPLAANGTTVVTPTATYPPSSQDITFTGTFTGYGGSTTCSAGSAVTVVSDPPAIVGGATGLTVRDTKTGEKPEVSWSTTNIVKCELEGDPSYAKTVVCNSEAACASVTMEAPEVFEDTEYTLTCYHALHDTYPSEPELIVTATADPIPHFTLSGDPLDVEIEFAAGGATTEPPVELEMTSYNGFRGPVVLDVDFSNLPLSPGTEVSSVSLDPSSVSFASAPFSKTALMEIYAAYRFTGKKTVEVCDVSGIRCITITILGTQVTPGWEPI